MASLNVRTLKSPSYSSNSNTAAVQAANANTTTFGSASATSLFQFPLSQVSIGLGNVGVSFAAPFTSVGTQPENVSPGFGVVGSLTGPSLDILKAFRNGEAFTGSLMGGVSDDLQKALFRGLGTHAFGVDPGLALSDYYAQETSYGLNLKSYQVGGIGGGVLENKLINTALNEVARQNTRPDPNFEASNFAIRAGVPLSVGAPPPAVGPALFSNPNLNPGEREFQINDARGGAQYSYSGGTLASPDAYGPNKDLVATVNRTDPAFTRSLGFDNSGSYGAVYTQVRPTLTGINDKLPTSVIVGKVNSIGSSVKSNTSAIYSSTKTSFAQPYNAWSKSPQIKRF